MAENGTLAKALTPSQGRFIGALMGARSVREAATTAQIKERTAWRYLSDDRIRGEILKRQEALLCEVASGLAVDLAQARQVLSDIMASSVVKPSVRVSAARAILEFGLKYAEIVSLAGRVAALEDKLETGKVRQK